MQFSQVAQQAAAGGGVMRALTIQAADIGLAFGTIGTVIGILATIAMPMIIGLFSDAGDEADRMGDALDTLTRRLNQASKAAEIGRTPIEELLKTYGAFAEQVQHTSRVVARAAVTQAMREFRDVAQSFTPILNDVNDAMSEYDRQVANMQTTHAALGKRTLLNASAWDEAEESVDAARATLVEITKTMGLSVGEAQLLQAALNRMAGAKGPKELAEASSSALDALDQVFTTAKNIPPEIALLIEHLRTVQLEAANATTDMEALADAAENVGKALAPGGRGDPRQFSYIDEFRKQLEGQNKPTKDDPKGTGGKGSDPLAQDKRDLERIRQDLLNELEVENEMHTMRNELLRTAKENELLTHKEYDALIEREKERHNDRLTAIDVWRHGTALDQTQAFMGQMATAFATGNEKMLQISKAFAAGEALVNAWRTYSQVMADPSLPWFAKIPAAISLFGSAVQAVDAINGIGKGGSGQTTAGGAVSGVDAGSSGGSPSPMVSLTLIGDQGFSRAQIVQITEAINDSADEGQRVDIRGRR